MPIQIEAGHPSTSTPIEAAGRLGTRSRTVPIQLVGVKDKGSTTPARKPRNHTPIVHAVIDEDDDDREV